MTPEAEQLQNKTGNTNTNIPEPWQMDCNDIKYRYIYDPHMILMINPTFVVTTEMSRQLSDGLLWNFGDPDSFVPLRINCNNSIS